jgi:hypothetical protein
VNQNNSHLLSSLETASVERRRRRIRRTIHRRLLQLVAPSALRRRPPQQFDALDGVRAWGTRGDRARGRAEERRHAWHPHTSEGVRSHFIRRSTANAPPVRRGYRKHASGRINRTVKLPPSGKHANDHNADGSGNGSFDNVADVAVGSIYAMQREVESIRATDVADHPCDECKNACLRNFDDSFTVVGSTALDYRRSTACARKDNRFPIRVFRRRDSHVGAHRNRKLSAC